MKEYSGFSSDTLRWIAASADAEIQSVRRLTGSTSSTLYSVEVTRNDRPLKLVLRLFTNVEWLADEPDLVRHEVASLKKAAEADVPTPELIVCDESGAHCGIPAILMTQLPGRVELMPADLDGWLYKLAEAIAPLHALDVGEFSWRYVPYNDVSRLEPPAWSKYPGLWERAIEIVNAPWPEARECFIHRDYHPVNVLWQDGRVSGIVDWPNACRGPAGIDVAWCRRNLAEMHGVDVAERFLCACQAVVGSSFVHHPCWDLLVLVEHLPGPPRVYSPWIDFGMQHLTDEIVQERVDEYLASVMTRL